MDIEHLNRQITLCNQPLRIQEAEPTSRVNKNLIENYRDYLAFHDIDYRGLYEKQIKSTNRYCKTVKA